MIDYLQYKEKVVNRFLSYVRIDTESDPESQTHPSSAIQLVLANQLQNELITIGATDVELDKNGYVYATIPASLGIQSNPVTFCAHMDTAPAECGIQVIPQLHSNYQGEILQYPDNSELTLSPNDSPELLSFIGHTIITASGKTLLGADDKAGIAEIMTAMEILIQHPEIIHPEIRVVFTPDEEIGAGTILINMNKLGAYGYTLDGGMLGELEDECFNANTVKLRFIGRNVHPGESKNRMINSAAIASRFVNNLPEHETPEHTELREGFFHVTEINGDENETSVTIIIRDFEAEKNKKRIEYIESIIDAFEKRYEGLKIEINIKESYRNMKEILDNYPEVVNRAAQAITQSSIPLIKKAIRGGTDGARLSFKGHPCPNLFAGGLLFHSKKEWIADLSLIKAVEVVVRLAQLCI